MATVNITTAEKVAAFIPIILNNGVNGGNACGDDSSGSTYYIPQGSSFTAPGATIWLNDDGTGAPPAGWYSDGSNFREWSGTVFGAVETCAVVTSIGLAYGVDMSGSFCSGVPSTFYVVGTTFENATELFTHINLAPTDVAAAGFYTDGVVSREWTGSAFGAYIFICGTETLDKGSIEDDACLGANGTESFWFLQGENFENATKMFTSTGVFAPTGYYSVLGGNPGVTVRGWDNLTGSFTSNSICS